MKGGVDLDNVNFVIKSDDILKIISILITAFTTYFVTKYTTNRPRAFEIKQLQLKNVYLPIYKLIRFDLNKEISKSTALEYATKIKPILMDNFELAFPQLHTLNDLFMDAIRDDEDYQEIFYKICYQVNLDYVILKKYLGYPSESSFSIFKRMNKKDKLKSILGWAFIIQITSMVPLLIIVEKYLNLSFNQFLLVYLVVFFLITYSGMRINQRKS